MNILVTGATGRVGSRLVPRLLQRGHSVKALVRQPENAQFLINQGVTLVQGDLLQSESLTEAIANADAVIHLAAFFRGATPEETHAVNLEGTLALASAAIREGVSRFIFASTNLVYGPGKDKPFNEEDLPKSEAPYPQTKAAAEQALLELHRSHGLGLHILRFAFVYGEGDPHLSEGLQWFRKWNPEQTIHMVHHADVAQAIILSVETPHGSGQIYNVADNEPVTAAEIMNRLNEPIPENADRRPIDASWLQIVDTHKIQEQLGFKPTYPTLRHAASAGVL
ncbi:NAD-dependent epimerase/dehydratase family protein [Paenibacillus sp. UNC451MF]|uniref:NAD-dependent epimerase/dehydratase family protein n=1 Tax=Paenibacillus sp. UNC451MF TaxID=1449063 RepID=UPI000491A6B4|nr:NAD-dependent epimerase/dehydratase family protein [Paenibacillus sp. UNC451MF]